MELRPYQDDFVSRLSRTVAQFKQIIGQAATGSGKTVIFSAISSRYKGNILILVHRRELLQQTRNTLYDVYGIDAQIIVRGMRSIPEARVYVGMVESVNKRILQIKNKIGLLIIDEAHRAEFNKIHRHFEDALTIGFTATPISASPKNPLKKYYNEIVCCVSIEELIKLGALCQNITYSPKEQVDRRALIMKGHDFDVERMAQAFSKQRYVESVVESYKKLANNTKAIVFNCNIEHSELVCDAFQAAGYDARHVDGMSKDRDEIMKWFKESQNGILCNCDIATVGLDVPSIETVIVNRSTKSLPLWLQMCGRGSRPYANKSFFTIIDMGGNSTPLGDWCTPHDWDNYFWHPKKPGKGDGVAPVKICEGCEAIIPARTMVCQYCGYIYPPVPIEETKINGEFLIVTKGINVQDLIEKNKEKKEYYPFFYIGTTLATQARNFYDKMTDDAAAFILERYHVLAKEWANTKNKKYNQWHQQKAKEHLYEQLQKYFRKWKPTQQINLPK
jgi:superfamily II DNA or RNA helicase